MRARRTSRIKVVAALEISEVDNHKAFLLVSVQLLDQHHVVKELVGPASKTCGLQRRSGRTRERRSHFDTWQKN